MSPGEEVDGKCTGEGVQFFLCSRLPVAATPTTLQLVEEYPICLAASLPSAASRHPRTTAVNSPLDTSCQGTAQVSL